MLDAAETEPDEGETGSESAKTRALSAARAQATDPEIVDVLRADCGLGKRDAERRVKGWAKKGLLEATRTAGRLLPIECLLERAKAGDTTAAVQLARREEKDQTGEVQRLVKQLASMSPAERLAFLGEMMARLGAG